jgi:hypothetical protein
MAHVINLNAEQEMEFLIGWATQTIAFCVSLSESASSSQEQDSQPRANRSQGNAVAFELWRDSLAQCGSMSEQVGAIFLHNVFRWCETQLRP